VTTTWSQGALSAKNRCTAVSSVTSSRRPAAEPPIERTAASTFSAEREPTVT
jgi:hypothetical protein